MTLNISNKTFIIYIAIKNLEKMAIYPKQKAQIRIQVLSKAKIRVLFFDKNFIAILAKYSDSSNIFSIENIIKFLKYNKMNNYAIKLNKKK